MSNLGLETSDRRLASNGTLLSWVVIQVYLRQETTSFERELLGVLLGQLLPQVSLYFPDWINSSPHVDKLAYHTSKYIALIKIEGSQIPLADLQNLVGYGGFTPSAFYAGLQNIKKNI